MSKHKEKQKLSGGWDSIQAVIWLLGLAIIAWQGWWWPGILVLVAISVIFEAVVKKIAPDAVVTVKKDDAGVYQQVAQVTTVQTHSQPIHRSDLLPTNCPKCGAPSRGHEVHWTGDQSADCPFCGANLPMKSA
jgi:hypothetical protein